MTSRVTLQASGMMQKPAVTNNFR